MNFVKRCLIPRKCISSMLLAFTYLTSFFFFVYCACVCLFDSVLACNDGYQFKLLFTDGECLSLIMNFFTGSWLFKKICLFTQPIFF